MDSQLCIDTLSPCISKSPKANCILNSKAKAAAFKVRDIKMHLQVMEQQRKKGKIKTDFSSVLKNSNANITSLPHVCSQMTYCALRITSSDQVYMYHFPCHYRFLQSPKNTIHIPFLGPVMLIQVKRMTKKTKVAKGFLKLLRAQMLSWPFSSLQKPTSIYHEPSIICITHQQYTRQQTNRDLIRE